MCVCAGLNTFVVYLASSLCCAMYTISVFSLDLWEGKVLCNRPSLAMGIHRDTLACIRMLGHTIKVCKGGGEGEGDKVVCIQLYVHRAMCMCVW